MLNFVYVYNLTTMRNLIYIALGIIMFSSVSPANCTTYIQNRNLIFSSDGKSYTKCGNTVFSSDGKNYTKSGNTLFSSDGKSYTKSGNIVFSSDGKSYTKCGNTIFSSDGKSYTHLKNITFQENTSNITKPTKSNYYNITNTEEIYKTTPLSNNFYTSENISQYQ